MMAFELKNCQTFKSTDVKRQIKVAWHGTRSKFLSVEGWWGCGGHDDFDGANGVDGVDGTRER